MEADGASDGRADVVAAARAGDEAAFAALVELHRGELRVHCYRMLGSFEDAEDLVQETFLRAWRGIGGFEGRSTVRAWLYRIATNACLDALDGRARRVLPDQLSGPSRPGDQPHQHHDVPWLQPFPDRLLDPVAPSEEGPAEVAIARETIELAFIAAIQFLTPTQRAVLIVRDVLGCSAKQTAALLGVTVASVNSALPRARAGVRARLPEHRLAWAPPPGTPTDGERVLLRRLIDAVERADLAAVAELLAEGVQATMPPFPFWFRGRDAVVAALAASWDAGSPDYVGRLRLVPTGANRHPAAAAYARREGDSEYRPFAISVLRIEGARIAGLTAFHDPRLFPVFGLPPTLR